MPIRLQSSAGTFHPKFLEQLPLLAQAMVANGMQPSDFVISKDRAEFPGLPAFLRRAGMPFAYTVSVKGQSFTVTERSDLSFYRYLYRLCSPNGAEAPVRDGAMLSALRAIQSRIGIFTQRPDTPAFKPPA